jgi:cytidylate kinase
MYRTAALLASRSGLAFSDGPALSKLLSMHSMVVGADRIFLDGEDVSSEIRAPAVSEAASLVSAHADVRRAMVALQRLFAAQRKVVAEGRDMGTVVFPSATLKVYIIADVAVRAVRRRNELAKAGGESCFDSVTSSLLSRDRRDRERADSPLRPCPSSIWLDTTLLTVGSQVERVVSAYRSLAPEPGHDE